MQEVRNAVDQAAREITSRYDFKNTGSEIVLGEGMITLRSSTEDRLAAARQVLEEKLVRRKVSLKGVTYGPVADAAGGTVRQEATLAAGISADKGPGVEQVHQGVGHEGGVVSDPGAASSG